MGLIKRIPHALFELPNENLRLPYAGYRTWNWSDLGYQNGFTQPMNRYSRQARAASIKCISCNAPVVKTVDSTYVCIECGESPIKPRNPVSSVERDGIRIRKSVKSNGNRYDSVSLSVSSSLQREVFVRISDPLPTGVDPSELRFSGTPGDQYLNRTREGIEFRGTVNPDETVTSVYHSPSESATSRAIRSLQPTVETIDSVEPPAEVSNYPVLPDGSEIVNAGDSPSASSHELEEGETSTIGGRVEIEPPATQPPRESSIEDNVSIERPRSDEDTPFGDGLLVTPESDIEPVISFVLPTKDEEDGIQECMDRIRHALRDLNLPGEIIVSDSSTDRTPEIARQNGARVVRPDRDGYGYAYRYAFEFVRGKFIVIGDADTTYDFEELPKLFTHVENGADMAMGSRLAGEIKPGAMPALHRYVGNPLLTKFLNVFYDAGVSDAHSGFRVIRRDALRKLNLRSDGMEFASEMVMEAGAKGLAIAEEPITYHERVGEATLDSFRDGWRHVKFMLTNAPSYIFSMPAIGLSMVGLVTMILSLADFRLFGLFFGIHTAIGGSLLTIVGYQIGSLAIFSSIAGDPIRKPKDKITEWVTESFQLEHGATVGIVVAGIGSAYVIAMINRWISSGYTLLPDVRWNIIAFTLIVLGTQTVFYSFFLSILGQSTART